MALDRDGISKILADILRREGGFVDNPSDKGGPTKFGITQVTLSNYLTKQASREDVQNLSEGTAGEIYRSIYISPFLSYETNLAELLVDCAVNHGVSRAKKWAEDYKNDDPLIMYKNILKQRIVFYGEIVQNNPKQSVFITGWLRRATEFIK